MSSVLSAQQKKRRVFFSFHYADIMRVNNVRMCGEFKTSAGDADSKRSIEGFYDESLWERAKSLGPDNIKTMIRNGVDNTSAVCILAGTDTWQRRWVRYEIARSVIDQRGLLTVHINNLTHHKDRTVHPLGLNPAEFMGVARMQVGSEDKYRLYEKNASGVWTSYPDYTLFVPLPRYLTPPQVGYVKALSAGTKTYDFSLQTGHSAIGSWIDAAATAVGR